MFSQVYWNKKYPKKLNESVHQHKSRVSKKRLQYLCYELNIAYHEDNENEELKIMILEMLVTLYQNKDLIDSNPINFLEGL